VQQDNERTRHSQRIVEEFSEPAVYAASYLGDTPGAHFFQTRLTLVKQLLGDCPGGRALDIGTGPGFALRLLRERGLKVVGMDLSREMLVHAGRTAGPVPLAEGSVERLPFSDASFDVVTCLGVLEYVWDLGAALGEMHRVLRPGGRLIVSMLNPGSPFRVLDLRVRPRLRRLLKGKVAGTVFLNTLGQSEFRTRLRREGFETVDLTYFDFNLLPASLQFLAPRAILSVARRLEWAGRSFLGRLGSGMLLKCAPVVTRTDSSPR
jgi:ubiquinone/menaquinone biosynthesis C-methylase UbiE